MAPKTPSRSANRSAVGTLGLGYQLAVEWIHAIHGLCLDQSLIGPVLEPRHRAHAGADGDLP